MNFPQRERSAIRKTVIFDASLKKALKQHRYQDIRVAARAF